MVLKLSRDVAPFKFNWRILNISRHMGYAISRQSYLVKASARGPHGGPRVPFEKTWSKKRLKRHVLLATPMGKRTRGWRRTEQSDSISDLAQSCLGGKSRSRRNIWYCCKLWVIKWLPSTRLSPNEKRVWNWTKINDWMRMHISTKSGRPFEIDSYARFR